MDLPKEWQTPEAQQALADALNRAIRNAWREIDSGALRGCTIEDLHRLPETAAGYIPHGLPHGAELARVARFARQGDPLAVAEVRESLARSRAQHEPVVRGIECEAPTRRGRPPQTRFDEVLARFLLDEVMAGSAYEAAVERAAGMFPTAYTKRGGADAMRPLTIDRAQKIVRRLLARKDPA